MFCIFGNKPFRLAKINLESLFTRSIQPSFTNKFFQILCSVSTIWFHDFETYLKLFISIQCYFSAWKNIFCRKIFKDNGRNLMNNEFPVFKKLTSNGRRLKKSVLSAGEIREEAINCKADRSVILRTFASFSIRAIRG